MVKKSVERHVDVRVTFLVPWSLKERSKKIVWGGRSPALRVLLEKLVDAVEKNGQQMIGAIIDGDFEIVPKRKERKYHNGPRGE